MSGKGNGNGNANAANHVGNLSDEYHAFGDRRDPILDFLKTEAQIEFNGHVGGRISKADLAKLSFLSGVGVATLRNWFYGDTKRPRSLSTHFVMSALGITTRRFRRDGTEIKSNW